MDFFFSLWVGAAVGLPVGTVVATTWRGCKTGGGNTCTTSKRSFPASDLVAAVCRIEGDSGGDEDGGERWLGTEENNSWLALPSGKVASFCVGAAMKNVYKNVNIEKMYKN